MAAATRSHGRRAKLARAVEAGLIGADEVTQDIFAEYLDTAGIPDPDLVIRTSGESRLSNFLPWQAAYSEFVFLPCFWPDFSRTDLVEAIAPMQRASAATVACRRATSPCDGHGPDRKQPRTPATTIDKSADSRPVSIVLVVVVLGLTWLGGLPFRLLCAIIAGAILYEWTRMCAAQCGRRPGLLPEALMLVFLGALIAGLPAITLLS